MKTEIRENSQGIAEEIGQWKMLRVCCTPFSMVYEDWINNESIYNGVFCAYLKICHLVYTLEEFLTEDPPLTFWSVNICYGCLSLANFLLLWN